MKISRFPHYVKKVHELGPRKSLAVIANRLHTSVFEQYTRYSAEQKKAAHTWPSLASRYEPGAFSHFLKTAKERHFSFALELVDQAAANSDITRQADAFAYNCFDILGSREQCLMSLPWHSDFRLRYQNEDADYLFDKKKFYKDFIIQSGLTDRLTKDIKVPWELARFQHLFVMGVAYKKTKDPVYVRSFIQHVTDFLDENPYLLGPNWVCPMDVSIRALNWVWAFELFKDAPQIPAEFWERYICSLYDHMRYLEHNWEIYTVTSNHYLSDLIGYFYLTWFFQDLQNGKKRQQWCHKELLKEFEKQVFFEGTDFEGSTNYHGLVTEIFYHFYVMSQESDLSVSDQFLIKLKKMFSFIDWCTVGDTGIVKIGDDDSGKILFYGITKQLVAQMQEPRTEKEKFFKEFGLAVYKTDDWHVTLRHHAYTYKQPSGHFHNDPASVTIAVSGIPVIVDPGSYVYTPSAVWRNAFRSIIAHNTFFIEGSEPTDFSDRSLFALDMPEHKVTGHAWTVKHDLYTLEAQRSVIFHEKKQSIDIKDRWAETPLQTLYSAWSFTLAPGIEVQTNGDTVILLSGKKKLLSVYCQDLVFDVVASWFAPQYGIKVPCKKLVARCLLNAQPVTITFCKL